MNSDDPGVFRRNLLLVGALHLLVLGGFLVFSTWKKEAASAQKVAWLDGGGAPVSGQEAEPAPEASETPAMQEETSPTPMPEETTEVASEIVLEKKDDRIKAVDTPAPTPSATPIPTPKPTPGPSPKPTARPSPKKPKAEASASPKKHPKPKASPHKSPTLDQDDDDGDDQEAKAKAKALKAAKAAKIVAAAKAAEAKKAAFQKAAGGDGDSGTADGSGGGHRGGAGHAGGGATAGDYGWYHSMLHDRFYSRWEQPTSIVTSNASFSATVKIRIEKDGTISDVSLAQTSGNDVMDQSVMEAARRVTQVDPLPEGLGDGGAYEVKINFELSQQSQ